MKTIRTAEAVGAALDWMVAKADTNLYPVGDIRLLDGKLLSINAGDYEYSDRWQQYSPSTDWAQGGPIIEQEKITISDSLDSWAAGYNGTLRYFGPTPLIAAMRCFVASELGETVEVPEELS